MVENVEAAGTGKEGEARRRRPMEVPAELDSRFLRVGDKLYRSAHDKQPVATITPDRIKAKDPNSLPDLIRLAKENGWTAIKVSGDAEFQRAAYLAASAQGIKVDGYKPDDKTKAAAEREQVLACRLVLHALRHDVEPQARGEVDDGPHDGGVGLATGHLPHEAPVDLQLPHREAKGQPGAVMFHDVRWGAEHDGRFLWVLLNSAEFRMNH